MHAHAARIHATRRAELKEGTLARKTFPPLAATAYRLGALRFFGQKIVGIIHDIHRQAALVRAGLDGAFFIVGFHEVDGIEQALRGLEKAGHGHADHHLVLGPAGVVARAG